MTHSPPTPNPPARPGPRPLGAWGAALLALGPAVSATFAQPISPAGGEPTKTDPLELGPEEPPPLEGNPDDEWTIRFEPRVWYASPSGDVQLPASSTASPRATMARLNLDSPRLTPYGELTFNTQNFRLALSALSFSAHDRGSVMPRDGRVGDLFFEAGDRLRSDLSIASWEASARWEFFEWPDASVEGGGWPFIFSAEAVGGARFYDLAYEIDGPGGSTRADELFAEPILGLRVVMDLSERLSIDLHSTLGAFTDGGDRSSFSSDITVSFSYRPLTNVGIQIGYRQLAFDLQAGEDEERFDVNGALAGVFGGVVVRF